MIVIERNTSMAREKGDIMGMVHLTALRLGRQQVLPHPHPPRLLHLHSLLHQGRQTIPNIAIAPLQGIHHREKKVVDEMKKINMMIANMLHMIKEVVIHHIHDIATVIHPMMVRIAAVDANMVLDIIPLPTRVVITPQEVFIKLQGPILGLLITSPINVDINFSCF